MSNHAGESGFHRNQWADALLDVCLAADLTVKVPPNLPLYAVELYETLGVSIEVDPAQRPFRENPQTKWRRTSGHDPRLN